MTAFQPGIVQEIESSLEDGARLASVDSTDDALVLVLEQGGNRRCYELDEEGTRELVQEGVVDLLAPGRPNDRTTPEAARISI